MKRPAIKIKKKRGDLHNRLGIKDKRKDEIVQIIEQLAMETDSKAEAIGEMDMRLSDMQELIMAVYLYGHRIGWEHAMIRMGRPDLIQFKGLYPSMFWGKA